VIADDGNDGDLDALRAQRRRRQLQPVEKARMLVRVMRAGRAAVDFGDVRHHLQRDLGKARVSTVPRINTGLGPAAAADQIDNVAVENEHQLIDMIGQRVVGRAARVPAEIGNLLEEGLPVGFVGSLVAHRAIGTVDVGNQHADAVLRRRRSRPQHQTRREWSILLWFSHRHAP